MPIRVFEPLLFFRRVGSKTTWLTDRSKGRR
jgi:hypothetical protein